MEIRDLQKEDPFQIATVIFRFPKSINGEQLAHCLRLCHQHNANHSDMMTQVFSKAPKSLLLTKDRPQAIVQGIEEILKKYPDEKILVTSEKMTS